MGLWQLTGAKQAEEIGFSSIKQGEESREQQGAEQEQKQDGRLSVFFRTLVRGSTEDLVSWEHSDAKGNEKTAVEGKPEIQCVVKVEGGP